MHLCTENPCPIQDIERLKFLENGYKTTYSMTTLEQFNEGVMREIPHHVICGHCNVKPTMQDFITQKLTEHKALILKMVVEKYKKAEEVGGFHYDEIKKEFLNYLDTM